MDNPILYCESFRNAVRDFNGSAEVLQRSLQMFDESVAAYCRAVDKAARVAGMQAENESDKYRGFAPTYTEKDFANA